MIENAFCVGAVALVCAFMVSFFAIANKNIHRAADIQHASTEAVSVIERFRDDEELITECFYDKDWNVSSPEKAAFRLFVTTGDSRSLGAASVETFSRYYGEEADIKYVRSSIYYEFSVSVEEMNGNILVTIDAVKYDKI